MGVFHYYFQVKLNKIWVMYFFVLYYKELILKKALLYSPGSTLIIWQFSCQQYGYRLISEHDCVIRLSTSCTGFMQHPLKSLENHSLMFLGMQKDTSGMNWVDAQKTCCVKSVPIWTGPYFPTFRLNAEYLPVFNPNTGKYGPEKL